MSELAELRGNASQEPTSFIREGLRAFIEFFQTDQFEKMARFYSPDTTLMLPHRGVIRGAGKLPALFRELKDAGLRDWRIEPNRVEQFGDIALESTAHTPTLSGNRTEPMPPRVGDTLSFGGVRPTVGG